MNELMEKGSGVCIHIVDMCRGRWSFIVDDQSCICTVRINCVEAPSVEVERSVAEYENGTIRSSRPRLVVWSYIAIASAIETSRFVAIAIAITFVKQAMSQSSAPILLGDQPSA
jgi:hypothetical protein